MRQAAPASVAEELHHTAERFTGAGGEVEPPPDGFSGEARDDGVVGGDLGQSGVHGGEARGRGVGGRRVQGPLPEGVQVGGFVEFGAEREALGEGEVREWHEGPGG